MSEVEYEWFGERTGIRILRQGEELVEELYAQELVDDPDAPDVGPLWLLVLASPSHASLERPSAEPVSEIYSAAMALPFTQIEELGPGHLRMRGSTLEAVIEKELRVHDDEVAVTLQVQPVDGEIRLRALLLAYAFVPGRPDRTYLPGLGPGPEYVVGDHQFRAPVAIVQRNRLAASLFPDVGHLAENRVLPTVLDIDCRNGVTSVPLISYGFAPHHAVPHVYFVADVDEAVPVAGPLRLKASLKLQASATGDYAFHRVVRTLWLTAEPYFQDPKPQALSFEDYARYCYPAAFSEVVEGTHRGWFEREIGGQICGGIPAGWGMGEGYVSWQCWFNSLRSAYGMRSWGRRLGDRGLVDRADKMLNLALAAPMEQGACPTTYEGDLWTWRGCLVRPTGEEYYDLANMAWKGIWLLRWARDFADCPRRDEIMRHCREMADCMMRHQRNGAFPSWLTRDHKPLPLLDRAAQSALPAWFLFELNKLEPRAELAQAALATTEFLRWEVVQGDYYYDFETFFSCSSKPCLQAGGQADHEGMRDPHTLQPPQNTLSMQWCAECFGCADALEGNYQMAQMAVLDRLALYQNVWPISYRKTAYTFGGFGAQNSDAEYLDARQAQFAETLCDFGVKVGSEHYFQRGVAAARAAIALVNHPRHEELGIYPNPNYGPGLMPENCCHDGFEQQNVRTGFDWGEGSALTTMAILLDKYGTRFTHPIAKWTVDVDACAARASVE